MKIGILGAGKIGPKFAKDALTIPGVEIAAIGSRSLDRAKAMAEQLGAKMAFGSYEEMIESAEVDLMYIATPHTSHAYLAKACINQGIPVLVEKAFALNFAEAKEMVDLARSKKVFLMEAMWSRFMPSIIQAKKWLDDGKIGSLCSIHADFGFRAKFDPNARLFNPDLGGGSLLDIGIYPVFLALLLNGKPDSIQAAAIIGETGVDEEVGMLFKYPNALAHLQCSFRSTTPCEAKIIGTEGTIFIHSRWHHSSKIHISYLDDRADEVWASADDWIGYRYEAAHVKSCLEAGLNESPLWNLDDSLLLMSTLDEVRRTIGVIYPQDC